MSIAYKVGVGVRWRECACELNKTVIYYLAKDMQPLYAVERPGFKKLVAKLDPKYALQG